VATVRCWHCNTENDPVATAGFCDRCGRKLEDVPETGIAEAPRRQAEPGQHLYPDRDVDLRTRPPFDSPAAELQNYEKQKYLGQASGVLFGMAAIQFLCGMIGIVVSPRLLGLDGDPLMLAVGALIVLGIAGTYVGLGIWARYQPLPATIIGLVLYVAMFIGNMILTDKPETIIMGIWLPILLIIMLARGVVAATKYNKLMQQLHDEY
jgi:hypothetical protein